MEFSLFAHMERLSPEQPHDVLYDEFISLCKMADDGGMRAIWTGEHHGMEFTIAPNPFLTLVDLARCTTNVRLGTGTVVAPFWLWNRTRAQPCFWACRCSASMIRRSRDSVERFRRRALAGSAVGHVSDKAVGA